MISNYTKPQLLIKQLLEVLPDEGYQDLNATIAGPQYDLMRVTNPDEKALMVGEAFVLNNSNDPADRQVLAYEELHEDAQVDLADVKLYGENMEGQLAVLGDNPEVGAGTDNDYFVVNSLQTPDVLRFVNDNASGVVTGLNLTAPLTFNSLGDPVWTGLYEGLNNEPVRQGDIAYITLNGVTTRRTVREVRKENVPSSYGSDGLDGNAANADINPVASTMDGSDTITDPIVVDGVVPNGLTLPATLPGWTGLVRGAKYQNKYGDRFTITVTSPASHNGEDGTANVNGRCRIRSSSGTFSADDVAIISLGTTYRFTIPVDGVDLVVLGEFDVAATLATGSIIAFTVVGAYTPLDTSTAGKDLSIQGTYTGEANTTYSIKVTKGSTGGFDDAEVQVYDSAGVDRVYSYVIEDGVWFGLGSLGLQFQFDSSVLAPVQNGLRTGDTYFVTVKASTATGAASLLVLTSAALETVSWSDADKNANAMTVELRRAYTGFISPKGNKAPVREWEATEDGVVLNASMVIELPNRKVQPWLPLMEGPRSRMFVSYKALRPAEQNEKYVRIRSGSDITKYFGKVDLENPLAYGCSKALGGSQGKPIFAIRVPSDNLEGYTEALRILEGSTLFYALSVMTYDVATHNALRMHVEAMSQEDTKKWRRGYVGSDTPEFYAVMQAMPDGTARTATITQNEGTNTRFVDVDGQFQTYGIGAGDIVRTNYSQNEWGEETFESLVIRRVNAEEEIILRNGTAFPVSPAVRYEIWRNNNAANIVKFMKARSAQYGSRRLVNVWADTPLALNDNNSFFTLPTYYLAAEIAGLRSAVMPQQGLTRTEVESISAIPSMYTKYTDDQLNDIASEGTFIVVQEVEDGPRFIRHQLTTDTNNGVMYYEDSVGTNFDDISYACKQVLEKYIGKRNTNPATLRDIFRDVAGVLRDKMEEIPGIKIGPQLIGYTDLKVWVDKNLKDRVNVYAKLEFPLPINTIHLTLNATASFNNTVIDASTLDA